MYRIPGITCVVNGAHDGLWFTLFVGCCPQTARPREFQKICGHLSAGDLSFWWALALKCPDTYEICEYLPLPYLLWLIVLGRKHSKTRIRKYIAKDPSIS